MGGSPEVSVVLPCKNEAHTIGICINKIKKAFKDNKIDGEIIVSDNSIDKSEQIARELGARIVKHKYGYGHAYLQAFPLVRGKYVIIGDSDDTYDFADIPRFLALLEQGNEFVIGNRMMYKENKKAMKWLHYTIGNPFLSWLIRFLHGSEVRDALCGMRALTKDSLQKLKLKTNGMEFAAEMVIKAAKNKLATAQIPIKYYLRSDKSTSKLHTFRDGFKYVYYIINFFNYT